MKVFNITYQFEESHKQSVTVKGVEGETLLDVALENNIDLHHNCGGVCACTTCHIYILNGMNFLTEISDKEEDFIDRANNPRINSRLGCQCEIHGDITLKVPDQSIIIGS